MSSIQHSPSQVPDGDKNECDEFNKDRQNYNLDLSDVECEESVADDESTTSEMSSVWSVTSLFFCIMSYLSVAELCTFKGLSKLFNFELDSKFICQNCHIFFAFNRFEMKKLLQYQLLSDAHVNMIPLVQFYFSFLNGVAKQVVFEQKKQNSDEKFECINFITNIDKNNNYKNCQYLYSIKCNSSSSTLIKDTLVLDRQENVTAAAGWNSIYTDELKRVDTHHTGDFSCHITRLIYDIINLATQQCKHSFDNKLTPIFLDGIILSNIYGCIKPLQQLFFDLLSNNEDFQHRISESRSNYQHAIVNGEECIVSTSDMAHYWQRLDKTNGKMGFSMYVGFGMKQKGRFACFSDLVCKGNFDALQRFIDSYKLRNNNNISEIQDSCCMYGVFSMITAFLRDDLLDDDYYISPMVYDEPEIYEGAQDLTIGVITESFSQALLFLIDPNLILKLKAHLISNMMIPFTGKELFEFDLFSNQRHHPYHRIKFLWKLCFSSHFLKQFYNMQSSLVHNGSQYHVDADVIYLELAQTVQRLYHNQKEFELVWHLNMYDDLVNNQLKKDIIHKRFRIIIQALFGLCKFECFRTPHKFCDEFGVDNFTHDGYFNLLPQNEKDMVQLYNMLDVETGDFEKLNKCFVEPQINKEFSDCIFLHSNIEVMKKCPKYGEQLVFDSLSMRKETPKTFLMKLWNLYGGRPSIVVSV